MELELSQKIKSLVPYKPGESDRDVKEKYKRDFFVKLASNENPFPPSPQVQKAMIEAVKNVHLYPDPSSRDLIHVASSYYQVKQEQILVGNGSNELIDLLIRLVCEPGDTVLTSQAAFIAYKICAQVSRAETLEVALKEGFKIDLKAFSRKLETLSKLPKVVFIPNPNNPTGSYTSDDEIKEFLERWANTKNMLIVFDEAYTEFVTAQDYSSALKYTEKYDNVFVLKTLSKVFGLAGLRLGFLIGNPEVLAYVHRIRNPFNVNNIAQAAGKASFLDTENLQNSVRAIIKERESFESFLQTAKIDYVPSQANFVMVKTKRPAVKTHEEFLKEGLIARPLIPYGIEGHLRISIGSREQMDFAKKVIKKVEGV